MISIIVNVCPRMAVKAGKSAHGSIAVQLEPETLEQWERDELAVMGYDDKREAFFWNQFHGQRPKYAEATADTARDLIAKSRAQRAKIRARDAADCAKYASELKEYLEQDVTSLVDDPYPASFSHWASHKPAPTKIGNFDLDADTKALRERAREHELKATALAGEINRAKREQGDAATAKRKAEAEEKRKRFEAALDAFAATHLTPIQRKRRERGLMTEDELLGMVRDDIFEPVDNLSNLDRYRRVALDDHMEIESEPAESVDDHTMQIIVAIEDDLRDVGGMVTARDHVVTSYGEEEARWQTLLVSVDWHGRPLSREYSVLYKNAS